MWFYLVLIWNDMSSEISINLSPPLDKCFLLFYSRRLYCEADLKQQQCLNLYEC